MEWNSEKEATKYKNLRFWYFEEESFSSENKDPRERTEVVKIRFDNS